MNGINKVIILGKLTKDAEAKTFGDNACLKLSVAVNKGHKNKQGTWVNKATFLDVTYWSKFATEMAPRFTKATTVYVEGELQIEKTEEGKTFVNIKAESVQSIDAKSVSEASQSTSDEW